MAFTEAIKLKVKHLAAFRCCRCQEIGIEVHHIIPQSENGADTLDNAAPLCRNCHGSFGANPVKRKEIKEMRNWWYQRVELQYKSPDYGKLAEINEKVDELTKTGLQNKAELDSLKAILKDMSNTAIDNITPATVAGAATLVTDFSQFKSLIQHDVLPNSFINRIKLIHTTFSDVLDFTHEQTINNFKSDAHPGREIIIWEHIMVAYLAVISKKKWSKEKKKGVLGILITMSSGPLTPEMLEKNKLLSKKEIETIAEQWERSWKDS